MALSTDVILEKVRGIFQLFDQNKDGGLNKEELEALFGATISGLCSQEQISSGANEVFRSYSGFIDGERGLTCDGLLQIYEDEGGLDTDYDVLALRLKIHIYKEPPFSIWDR
ncbi:hypothetical protein L1987_34850 [Smallanthus sonchifolius]|uniref:Uncharacterized protein n=1 Tax=Smallanthus sonchifolius TaxID=185202 RepID=A0ACB9HVQ9_9ASTR|nr:hypothetical protein L1987_34850 [Smallanthus sonchifolius]